MNRGCVVYETGILVSESGDVWFMNRALAAYEGLLLIYESGVLVYASGCVLRPGCQLSRS